MEPQHFSPHPLPTGARALGCMACTHFHGQRYYEVVICEHHGGRHAIGIPAMGCAYWEREPGADDE